MFSEFIRNEAVADDKIMVSFDVSSLYTNVSIVSIEHINYRQGSS